MNQNQVDITKLNKTELKALAYESICSINRFKNSLSVIENEIAKREQEEREASKPIGKPEKPEEKPEEKGNR